MHHLEDTKIIGEMQYGSWPGKQCRSTILHKVLLNDISRWMKSPLACIENDSMGYYDRLVNGLVLLFLRKFGFHPSITSCFSHLWDNTCHFIKTQYGTSTVHYSSSLSCPLYGPGQGSTCGPLFWIICYVAILHSLDPRLTQAVFLSVCRRVKVQTNGGSFMDDSGLVVATADDWSNSSSNDNNDLHLLVTA
jgi:hypothetical protein